MENSIPVDVKLLIPLIKAGMSWEKYERNFPDGKLSKKEDELSQFVAEKLARQLISKPSAISLRVVHASNNRIYIDGNVQKDAESTRVEGDIAWKRVGRLSRQKSFQGYVKLNPQADHATKEKDYERYISFYRYYLDLALKVNGFFYAIIGGILSIFLTKDIPRENARLIALCIPIAVLMSFAFGVLFLYGSILWGRVRWGMNVIKTQLNIERNLDVQILTLALRIFGVIFIFVGILMLVLMIIFMSR